jgi:hypothetical protein
MLVVLASGTDRKNFFCAWGLRFGACQKITKDRLLLAYRLPRVYRQAMDGHTVLNFLTRRKFEPNAVIVHDQGFLGFARKRDSVLQTVHDESSGSFVLRKGYNFGSGIDGDNDSGMFVDDGLGVRETNFRHTFICLTAKCIKDLA